ncbi:YbaB/EbfC family nucleoid-associated protein [Roseisolibacter agri]|uniref:Nucleoid-associated protein rosag_27820 n=1 Tax=Roseisolibacter agri TaxID=2014610 RepID=A0AA37Q484_9BACT|nr:YbaB/EbfC family nucleoid-associated protein [Roseisolibacter agri]GLC26269.1 nucleoid-associated protein [Roseisolibacter agri]
MDIMKLMQQAQEMQGRLQQIQDELAQRTVTGTAGGGMVTVEADGKGAVRSVKIDPSVVSADDVAMLEDLVTVAVRDAQAKAKALEEAEMGKAAGGMNLPFQLPF